MSTFTLTVPPPADSTSTPASPASKTLGKPKKPSKAQAKRDRQARFNHWRDVLRQARLGIKSGGGTARLGWVYRQVTSHKFETFTPQDVADAFANPKMVQAMLKKLGEWASEADPNVSPETLKQRERELQACGDFLRSDKPVQVADAIRGLTAEQATRWSERGEKTGEDYGMTLMRAVSEMIGITITATRRGKLNTEFPH